MLQFLLCFTLLLSPTYSSTCGEIPACANCTNTCSWFFGASLSSCTRSQSIFPASSCPTQRGATTYPPSVFRHQCMHGGALSDVDPLGATCDCLDGRLGSKCQACDQRTRCGEGQMCDLGLGVGVLKGQSRELSCECESELCKSIGFGPGKGVVNIKMKFGLNENQADIDILQQVDNSSRLVLKSPFLFRGRLHACDFGKDVPCSQVCGGSECPSDVAWNADETCRVWTCQKSLIDDGSPNSEMCPPLDAPWSIHAESCDSIKNMMKPPYQFVCVVQKGQDPRASVGVNGYLKCGFSTFWLSHGSVSLNCRVGTCVPAAPTLPPIAPAPNGTSPWVTKCSGNSGDRECWMVFYFAICLVPILYTSAAAFWVHMKERETAIAVDQACGKARGGRFTMIRTNQSNLEAIAVTEAAMPRTALQRAVSESDEEDEFIQGRQPLVESSSRSPSLSNLQSAISPLLSFHGISFKLNVKSGASRTSPQSYRTVLHYVSGHIRPGEFVACLGPSGSGKTSLIDILAGRKNVGRISGVISLDNRAVLDANELRRRVGYVTQDDVLPGTSTVHESLLFHATLRGKKGTSLLQRCERVEDVLAELNLIHCRGVVIGDFEHKSLSGGEKRRVSIANELLGEHAQLLLLDEPTSGLDSSGTQSVISALSAVVVKEKKTVVMSIHQPSTALFRSFDRIALLSATGRLLYLGPSDSLEMFFGPFPTACNPAEYLIDIASSMDDEHHRLGEEKFESSVVRAEQDAELRVLCDQLSTTTNGSAASSVHVTHSTKTSWSTQLRELSIRSLRQTWRHPSLALTNVVATIAIAVICGVLYAGVSNDLQGALNRAGLYFFFMCFLVLASLADLGVFQEERLIVMRERASGAYSASAWIVTKLFAEILPLRLVPLMMTTFILTFVVGLNPDPHAVLFMYLILLGVSLVATLQFLSLGMMIPRRGSSNFAAVLVAMFSLLMSGFLLQFEGTGGNKHSASSGFEWMQSFSVLHFAFEALMVNEMQNLNFQIIVRNENGDIISKVSASGALIFTQLGLKYDNFSRDIGVIVLYIVVFSLVCFAFLQLFVVERR